MWIAFYNSNGIGDVLLLTAGKAKHIAVESQGDVTLITDRDSGEVVGVNLFNISNHLTLDGQGKVELTPDQVQVVNQLIAQADGEVEIVVDNRPKFVAGYVEECEDHTDSDHLHITQTNVGDETVQIVCGADNIQAGLTVLVALPGAVMPSGAIIWPGELRGEASYGMICSTRELGLEAIEDYPGIWELDSQIQPGTPLADVIRHYQG